MQARRGVELRPVRPSRPEAAEGLRWCGTCRLFVDEGEFGWDTTRDQPKRTCRPCAAARQKAYNAANRERLNFERVLAKYGLTREEHDRLVLEQLGRCALCGAADPELAVDHCHGSGRVRGLLCRSCNQGLGLLRDDVAILQEAIAYLERNQLPT
jgi:hypothetical protein